MSTPKRFISRATRSIDITLSSNSPLVVGRTSLFSASSRILRRETESGFDTSWLSKKIVGLSAVQQKTRRQRSEQNMQRMSISKIIPAALKFFKEGRSTTKYFLPITNILKSTASWGIKVWATHGGSQSLTAPSWNIIDICKDKQLSNYLVHKNNKVINHTWWAILDPCATAGLHTIKGWRNSIYYNLNYVKNAATIYYQMDILLQLLLVFWCFRQHQN